MGIELAQGAGGGVTRIGKGFEFVVSPLLVEGRKRRDGHVNFAADFDVGRRAVDAKGYGADGADVVGNVFADDAVTAGDAADELTVFINEVDGKTIDFEFDDVF